MALTKKTVLRTIQIHFISLVEAMRDGDQVSLVDINNAIHDGRFDLAVDLVSKLGDEWKEAGAFLRGVEICQDAMYAALGEAHTGGGVGIDVEAGAHNYIDDRRGYFLELAEELITESSQENALSSITRGLRGISVQAWKASREALK
jgi:hypothetical protein